MRTTAQLVVTRVRAAAPARTAVVVSKPANKPVIRSVIHRPVVALANPVIRPVAGVLTVRRIGAASRPVVGRVTLTRLAPGLDSGAAAAGTARRPMTMGFPVTATRSSAVACVAGRTVIR